MELHAGAVHVWRVDLDGVPRELERLLDSGERERAQRIVREPARGRWIAARGTLRALLGAYLGERPDHVRIETEEHGKPVLVSPRDGARLHFNLSHSGALAVYALTELCPVGVDVELMARHPARMQKHGPERLRTWVRYEAEAKRTGMGIAGGALRAAETAGWIVELDGGPGAIAAMALARKPDEIVYLDWSAAVPERQLGGHLAQTRR